MRIKLATINSSVPSISQVLGKCKINKSEDFSSHVILNPGVKGLSVSGTMRMDTG